MVSNVAVLGAGSWGTALAKSISDQGHRVRLWARRQDLVDAVAVADRLEIEIETVNFSAEYKDRVFSEFLREYRAGRFMNRVN